MVCSVPEIVSAVAPPSSPSLASRSSPRRWSPRDADRHRLASRRKRRSNAVKAPFRWDASIAGEIYEITFL
jgi:hypothetical protein